MEMHDVSLLTCNYVLATCDIIAGDNQFTFISDYCSEFLASLCFDLYMMLENLSTLLLRYFDCPVSLCIPAKIWINKDNI